MKANSSLKSTVCSLRVLVASAFAISGAFIALFGFATLSAHAQSKYGGGMLIDPLVPAAFDCSRIRDLSIDKQENMRAGAIMIFCGEAEGGSASTGRNSSQYVQRLLAPLAFGTTDIDLITGGESFPNITQSETFTAGNPDDPSQIIVAYNDSRGRNANPINISGASVSSDGGNTFTRITNGSGQSPFSNTLGDPVILYNRPTATWFTIWLDGGCGGQGLGGYKTTTPSNANSWTHYCIHSNNNDDRESGWADNSPSSPFYGRMYTSWNDFNRVGGGIFVRYSTDDGLTWTNERQVTTTFYRNVQITGDLATGHVFIAAMDEMGGGLGNRANRIYRSTDGGNTWALTYVGPTFAGPGRGAAGYFACMYATGYWRHMGWGEPAAFNGVVSYVYAARNTSNGDAGNIFYIRSTNDGATFSAPFMLNTDNDVSKAQWQANLSAASDGSLLAVWYDEREGGTGCAAGVNTPCYRMWARKSTDNGLTWLSDMQFSDVVSPLPAQPDPGIQAAYVGDYDYASSVGNQHLHAWVDGRAIINGTSQQDAFHDREPASPGASPTPTATATATPNPTATPLPTATPIPTATPTPGPITLTASGYLQGRQRRADLRWSGAISSNVDVYRDGALIVTTVNDGFYTDRIGGRGPGTFTYQVCNAGTQTCSNQAPVNF